jgi:hypothetical protein
VRGRTPLGQSLRILARQGLFRLMGNFGGISHKTKSVSNDTLFVSVTHFQKTHPPKPHRPGPPTDSSEPPLLYDPRKEAASERHQDKRTDQNHHGTDGKTVLCRTLILDSLRAIHEGHRRTGGQGSDRCRTNHDDTRRKRQNLRIADVRSR